MQFNSTLDIKIVWNIGAVCGGEFKAKLIKKKEIGTKPERKVSSLIGDDSLECLEYTLGENRKAGIPQGYTKK